MARKQHYHIMTATFTYLREGPKQRTMNTVVTGPTKNFNAVMINNARIALTQRIMEEMDVQQEQIREFTINGISYLGLMTPNEFEGVEKGQMNGASAPQHPEYKQ